MRTTVDLPDELLRQVKARAALEGLKLKELIARYIAQGLAGSVRPPETAVRPLRRRSALPVIQEATIGKPIQPITRAELAEMEQQEDLAKFG